MGKRIFVFCLWLCLFSFEGYSGEQVILRLKPVNYLAGLQYLIDNDYDIAGIDVDAAVIDVVVDFNPAQDHPLSRYFEVVESKSPTTRADLDSRFVRAAEVETILEKYETDYPKIAKRVKVGESLNGKPIWAIKISDNLNQDEIE